MIPISYYNLRIIFFDCNYYALSLFYRVNLLAVYDYPDIQKTEKNLLLAGDDNMIGAGNNATFSDDIYSPVQAFEI